LHVEQKIQIVCQAYTYISKFLLTCHNVKLDWHFPLYYLCSFASLAKILQNGFWKAKEVKPPRMENIITSDKKHIYVLRLACCLTFQGNDHGSWQMRFYDVQLAAETSIGISNNQIYMKVLVKKGEHSPSQFFHFHCTGNRHIQ
jgi:hypothetical protein